MDDPRVSARAGSFEQRLRVPTTLDFPGSHLGLRWSFLDSSDVEDLVALDLACLSQDRPSWSFSPDGAASLLDFSDEDRREVLGGRDSRGVLRAAGSVSALAGCEVELVCHLEALIDPEWKRRGIGRALLDWQDGRARQMLAEDGRNLPVSIESAAASHLSDRRRLLAAAGYAPVRTVEALSRTISADYAVSAVTGAKLAQSGVRLIDYSPDLMAEVLTVLNRADTAQQGRQLLPGTFRHACGDVEPDLSFVAVTDDDSPLVVGFLLASERAAFGERDAEARISFQATERGWRHRGIGDALMDHHLRACVEAGLSTSTTSVDTVREASRKEWLTRWDYYPRSSEIVYAVEV